MEIDDILNSVSHVQRPGTYPNTEANLSRTSAGANRGDASKDIQRLTRAWVSERVGPDLLPWDTCGDVVDRVMGRVRAQVEQVEQETGNMDPKTNFRLVVVQTELERVKFLIRSLLRARIAKIDAHPLYYLSTPTLQSRLSPPEHQYVTTHQAILHEHYISSFLGGFPEQLRRLDDTAGGISMIDAPDLEKAVFCRVLRDVDDDTEGLGIGPEIGTLKRGGVYVVRYERIREAVRRGDVELI